MSNFTKITIFIVVFLASIWLTDPHYSALSTDPITRLPGYNEQGQYVNPNEKPEDKGWTFIGDHTKGREPTNRNLTCFDLTQINQGRTEQIESIRYLMLLNNSVQDTSPWEGADPESVAVIGANTTVTHGANALAWINSGAETPGFSHHACGDTRIDPNYSNRLARQTLGLPEQGCTGTSDCACALGDDPDKNLNDWGARGGYIIWDVACSEKSNDVNCRGNAYEDPSKLIIDRPGQNDFCIGEVGTSEEFRLYVLDYDLEPENSPPTASANITSSDMQCTGNYTGITTNNPITVTSTHSDPDGIENIERIGIWLSRDDAASAGANLPSSVGSSGSMYLNVIDPNNFQFQQVAHGKQPIAYGPGENRYVFTVQVPTINSQNYYASEAAADATWQASVRVTNITPDPANNRINVRWEIKLNPQASGSFYGKMHLYAYSRDSEGLIPSNAATHNWVLAQDNWYVDLVAPRATLSNTFTSNTTLNINYGSQNPGNEPTAIYNSRTRTSCTALGMSAGENITLSRSGNTYVLTNNNPQGCSENILGSLNYTLTNNSDDGYLRYNLAIQDRACNAHNTSLDVEIPDPWLMTSFGDTYANRFDLDLPDGNVSNSGIVENGLAAEVSSYLYSYQNSSTPNNSSAKNYSLGGYRDNNGSPREAGAEANWFAYFVARFTDELSTRSLTQTTISGTTAGLAGVSASNNDIHIFESASGTTLNINTLTCNTKTIFIVRGNLNITPNVTIPNNSDGCIFLVNGTTTINAGSSQGSNNSVTHYDRVDALIMTNRFRSLADSSGNDGLLVDGAVIMNIRTNDPVSEFLRDTGLVRNDKAPSELFRYDGIRYMYLFEDVLTYKEYFQIREKQFIGALEN